MERKKLQELNAWLESPNRKPLVLWGARQVGKTYLIKDLFAENTFSDYVYIDFKKNDEARNFFSTTSDPEKYLSYIESSFGKRVSPTTPLIMDEVQQCHQALTSLKYFKQDYRELPVIATGSMVRLSLKHSEKQNSRVATEDNPFLFPVGAINSLNLYPLNFDEYLLNVNPVLLQRIEEAYASCQPLVSYDHELALSAMYEYLAIGGLPEALDTYIQTNSYIEAKRVLAEVYDNYLADMDTYNVSSETILKTRNVYRNIFKQLNMYNKNFKVSQVDKGKSNRDYFNAYQWLELARVVYRSRSYSGKVTLPFTEEEEGLFRLYLSDPGMFTHQSGVAQSDFIVQDKRNALLGIFYESYVADEFMAREIPLYYWLGKREHEFEFIVENEGKVLPVDVKKGTGKMNSLTEFRATNPYSTAIKIHAGNFGYDAAQDILSIPLYAVFALAENLAQGTALPKPNKAEL